MSSWRALDEEIARWRDAGRTAELWWRDDDVADATANLDRLLSVQREAQVPLALAVIPAIATPALAARLAGESAIDLLQHGYAHVNHAPANDKKCELGPHRPAMLVLGELGTGWLALERLFGERPLPVLVPPWNRIAPALVPALPEIGFVGLSSFGRRPRAEAVRGLRQVNAHLDVVDWKGRRGFVGEETALAALMAALRHARQSSHEPVGVLSHHLVMDEAAWDFLRSLLEKAGATSGVEVRAARRVFASREARP
jgi:hypothetical protein